MQAQIGTDVAFAAACLQRGSLVGIPTETVYGLAANAFNEATVAQIFTAKQRPTTDPLIVHAHSIRQIEGFVAEFPALARHLAAQFWPGALTLLLPKNEKISSLVTAGLPRVAVRIPHHPLTLALLQALAFPLAAPSANPFGYISPTTAAHVVAQLGEEVAYVLDGGPSAIGLESTIVGFDANERAIVYRLGGVSLEQLAAVAGPLSMAAHIEMPANPLAAPGMLTSHYAPRTPLLLGNLNMLLPRHKGKRVGILSLRDNYREVPPANQRHLSPTGSLHEAAHNLFAMLRELDGLGLEVILAEPMPETGLGLAINDRLKRAAALH